MTEVAGKILAIAEIVGVIVEPIVASLLENECWGETRRIPRKLIEPCGTSLEQVQQRFGSSRRRGTNGVSGHHYYRPRSHCTVRRIELGYVICLLPHIHKVLKTRFAFGSTAPAGMYRDAEIVWIGNRQALIDHGAAAHRNPANGLSTFGTEERLPRHEMASFD